MRDRPPPHRCPGPGCNLQVAHDKLACRAHWYQVSMPVRDAVWAAWKHGRGAGSPEHNEAMRDAIAEMRPL